jgi:gamma-glutamyltranspeptidase/glutathione hydrolase
MIEALRHAYVDRNFSLGDPAFVDNPLDRLLAKDYAAGIRAKIVAGKAGRSADVRPDTPPHEATETAHYSIVDKDGNAVAVTYTINGGFGAQVIGGNTGFFLNDEMDDFTIKPGTPNLFGLVQGKKNAIQPGKRPLSSMSPTIVAKDGRTVMVIGGRGGSRIITIVLEAVMNVIDYGLDPQEAVDAPRIHHQWLPDEIFVEPMALSPDTRKMLTDMGYKVTDQAPWGAAGMIVTVPKVPARTASAPVPNAPVLDAMAARRMKPGWIYGANDDRMPAGAAIGY